VNPKQLTVPEILPALTAGTINVVNAPALAAEQLQWSSLLDHINTSASGIGIGALVFTSSKINSLPADMKELVISSGNNTGNALTQSIRNQDNLAFGRLKARMTAYQPTQAEQEQWKALFKQTRARLKGAHFEPKVFEKSVSLAGAD
jgi:TRAP-type C4-dicarboxylate transport system substrate-binding protein